MTSEARAAAAFLEGSPVPVLPSAVDTSDRQFAANRDRMATLVADLQESIVRTQQINSS
jgi:hypothetical protein